MARLAYLGVGAMGGPMARRLAAAGHALTVWGVPAAGARDWAASNGADAAATPAEAVAGADAVFASLPGDAEVEAVALGPGGALAAMAPGALFVDHSTTSAPFARRLHQAGADAGLPVLDAPVSGGVDAAEKGALSILCGGTLQAFARARPLLAAYAARVTHVGEGGTGQIAKMCAEVAVAGTLQGVREALALALAAGLDAGRVYQGLAAGSAQSRTMDECWSALAADGGQYADLIGWLRKDLAFALDEARRSGVSLPVAALADQLFGAARQDAGLAWAGPAGGQGIAP